MAAQALEIVQRMWTTYREGGVEAALALLDPAVEFVTHDGTRYEGHEGVLGFFASFAARGERFAAAPFTFEPVGEGVLVAGHRRISSAEHVDAEYMWFTHAVRDELIVRMVAHTSRADARAALTPGS